MLIFVKQVLNVKIFTNSFPLAPSRAATILQSNRNNSITDRSGCDLNTTLNRSKIIDPMQLLRSSSKKDTSKYKLTIPQVNIPNWKHQQSLLLSDNDDDRPTPSKNLNMNESHTKTPSPLLLQQSPITPFSSNDRTRIARIQLHLDGSVGIGNSLSNATTSTSLNYIKKLSAVKKVQDVSANLANLSTSPSGRLEPLVTVEDFTTPKLKLNDLSLNEFNLSHNVSNLESH